VPPQAGARASANLYTLAQTCRANGVAPLAYFEHLYEHLPLANTAADLKALLPAAAQSSSPFRKPTCASD